MKKLFTWNVLAIANITFWVGIACASVGEMTGPSHIYPWHLPFTIFLVFGTATFFGYMAGKEN